MSNDYENIFYKIIIFNKRFVLTSICKVSDGTHLYYFNRQKKKLTRLLLSDRLTVFDIKRVLFVIALKNI